MPFSLILNVIITIYRTSFDRALPRRFCFMQSLSYWTSIRLLRHMWLPSPHPYYGLHILYFYFGHHAQCGPCGLCRSFHRDCHSGSYDLCNYLHPE
jgi:hypothetical protein